MLKRAFFICTAVVLGVVWGIGSMHESRRAQFTTTVHRPVAEAEDIDFMMHDLEQAQREAREAYEKIIAANRRVYFDPDSIMDKP